MRHNATSSTSTLLLAALLASIGGCLPNSLLVVPVRTNRQLVETTLLREALLAPKIAIIDVEGILANADSPALLSDGEHAVSLLLEKLDHARHDRRVKAVILRINSPGGTVAASELMHAEIVNFRNTTGKPVIAMTMDVAASGGYYIATACDEIVSLESTVTGSIGVIMQLFDVTGTMSKLGVRSNAIKSGDRKAGGSPFQSLSEADRQIFQNIIDEMYERFVHVVDDGRPQLNIEQVRALADGRVYSAKQALELGLIDRITTMPEAIALTKERIGARHANLIAYRRPHGYAANYYAAAGRPTGEVNMFHIQTPSWLHSRARFMYLWSP